MTVAWTQDMRGTVLRLRLAGVSVDETADKIGVNRDTLRSWCRHHGISTASARSKAWREWQALAITRSTLQDSLHGSLTLRGSSARPDVPSLTQKPQTARVLRPAVESYLRDEPMKPEHIAAMRAYLRQWIAAPAFQGRGVEALRSAVGTLSTRTDIDHWLDRAMDAGIDPL